MFNSAAQLIEDIDRHLSVKGLRFGDRFEVSHRIGHGSYAEIYVAKNLAPKDGEPPKVVVKALNPLLQGEIEAELVSTLVDNFKFEAETMVSFDHENIARFFGSGFAFDHFGRSFYYLILEYIPGATLAQSCSQQPLFR